MKSNKIYLILLCTILTTLVFKFIIPSIKTSTNFGDTLYIVENSLDITYNGALAITDELVRNDIDIQYIDLKASDNDMKLIEVCTISNKIIYIQFNESNNNVEILDRKGNQ